MSALSNALSDGSCLIDSTGSEHDLKTVLLKRLTSYYTRLGNNATIPALSLEQIQQITAVEALSVIQRVQQIIGLEVQPGLDEPPLIGTRDLKELKTLLSIVFRWGIDPLYAKVNLALPHASPSLTSQRIFELDESSEVYASLSRMISDLLALVFPDGPGGRVPQTLITTTIIEKHAVDLLKPCILIGWLPKSLASDLRPVFDAARPMTMRFLNYLTPLQTITGLGSILSSSPRPLPYVRKLCISLLSQQLMRPHGVRSLCAAVFGESDSPADDTSIDKMLHITRVLQSVPANMNAEEYFSQLIPKVVALLAPQEPTENKRVAAFAVSRFLSADSETQHRDVISKITLAALLDSFSPVANQSDKKTSISSALDTLITLVANADPSPTLISTLLSPILPTLYSMLHSVDQTKAVDPTLREPLRGLLITWGKIIAPGDGIDILWSIVQSEGMNWIIDLEGGIKRAPAHTKPLALLTPQDLKADEDYDLDSNFLGLYPDPKHFVQLLRDFGRADISSDLFVKLLETYRDRKINDSDDPTRPIIMQMQTQLTDGKSSTSILCKPGHLLSFIKHVLEPQGPQPLGSSKQGQREKTGVNLQIFAPQDEFYDEGDSDDETPSADLIDLDVEMVETALHLLLSILEANEDLSARTAPILNDIFSLLEPFAREGSEALRPLAREARMVMTARLASTSRKHISTNSDEEGAQEIYQKALKLLQDPILPVRAHGLLLLRQLVTPSSSSSQEPKLTDAALVPAILSIFLQAVQDDDSYIFLNAVQGLAGMVDRFGKEVLKGLIKEYADGFDGLKVSTLTQRDLDSRIRVGEALATVIRRCGEALSVPTTLRTSSLSLLADCESTSPLAMLPYVTDLVSAMLDILQVELEPASALPTESQQPVQSMDSEPLSTRTKVPPFRRGAIHFLTLVMRETAKLTYESSFGRTVLSDGLASRARTTLAYVASVDADDIVRVMAREAIEELDLLNQSKMGL
ncbi:hypothetical protein H0H93_002365 [Arthromyces matolae]|nr:hypothetical protein H0H93_002365 [Arthromyces matolae]